MAQLQLIRTVLDDRESHKFELYGQHPNSQVVDKVIGYTLIGGYWKMTIPSLDISEFKDPSLHPLLTYTARAKINDIASILDYLKTVEF